MSLPISHRRLRVIPFVAAALAAVLGCRSVDAGKLQQPVTQVTQTSLKTPAPKTRLHNPFTPSNSRLWAPDQAVLPRAEFLADSVTIRNVRNCTYLADRDYIVNLFDETYDLNAIQTVDFILVPFADMPRIAHTMLSFGFGGGKFVTVSVEARFEEGEEYSLLRGAARQYELMYVVADERDLIRLRTRYRHADVYLYRGKATPAQVRDLFVDVLRRVNKLATEPEFYALLSNNCTTNVARHVNDIVPGRVPYGIDVMLPGLSDKLAYDLGLLDTQLSFEETKRLARVNDLAEKYFDDPDFSTKIRQR
jgi:hypothetical protein